MAGWRDIVRASTRDAHDVMRVRGVYLTHAGATPQGVSVRVGRRAHPVGSDEVGGGFGSFHDSDVTVVFDVREVSKPMPRSLLVLSSVEMYRIGPMSPGSLNFTQVQASRLSSAECSATWRPEWSELCKPTTWVDTKSSRGAVVHHGFHVPAIYLTSINGTPRTVKVRTHTRNDVAQPDVQAAGVSGRVDLTPRVVFDLAEVANPLARAYVIVGVTEIYRLAVARPPRDGYQEVEAVRLPPAECATVVGTFPGNKSQFEFVFGVQP